MIASLAVLLSLGILGTISFAATDARARLRQGFVGSWVERGFTERYFTGFNATPQATKVVTFTVSNPGNDTNIPITIGGLTVTVNTGSGLSAAAVTALLSQAIDQNGLVRGRVTPTYAGTTITLTGRHIGDDFQVVLGTGLSALTTVQQAAFADPVPFGRIVIKTGINPSGPEALVGVAKSVLFRAQVITVTPDPAFVSGAKFTVSVYEIRDGDRVLLKSITETSATNLDTTIDTLVANLNTALAGRVVATANNASATAFLLTAGLAGLEFDVDVSVDDSGASVPPVSIAYTEGPSHQTSLGRALAGLSMRSDIDVAVYGSEEGVYGPNAGVLTAEEGKVWVASDEVVTPGATVFVELGNTATNGRLFMTGSSTRVALSRRRVRWERDGNNADDGIAVVRLDI
jgi:hypothetical protein